MSSLGEQIRTAVIGVGYLGTFHAEKYASLPGSHLAGVADHDGQRAAQLADRLKTAAFDRAEDLVGLVDAVSIVVPTILHYRTAKRFLDAGIHVLLEKPMTVTVEEADELVRLAEDRRCVLQIGHIERYNPAIRAVKELCREPRYIQAERCAPFTVRCTDVNVVLDLMIHDLDIVCDLAGAKPRELSAAGASVITSAIDSATVRIVFENGCVADVTASRVSDEKKRLLRAFDGDTLFTADFQTQKAYRARRGSGEVPALEAAELETVRTDTLRDEIQDFLGCVREGRQPLVTGAAGRRALALAECITRAVEERRTGFVPAP